MNASQLQWSWNPASLRWPLERSHNSFSIFSIATCWSFWSRKDEKRSSKSLGNSKNRNRVRSSDRSVGNWEVKRLLLSWTDWTEALRKLRSWSWWEVLEMADLIEDRLDLEFDVLHFYTDKWAVPDDIFNKLDVSPLLMKPPVARWTGWILRKSFRKVLRNSTKV